jgi:hypothetical protein
MLTDGVDLRGAKLRAWYERPTVLLAAKAYGSVFYDKLTPSIVLTKW